MTKLFLQGFPGPGHRTVPGVLHYLFKKSEFQDGAENILVDNMEKIKLCAVLPRLHRPHPGGGGRRGPVSAIPHGLLFLDRVQPLEGRHVQRVVEVLRAVGHVGHVAVVDVIAQVDPRAPGAGLAEEQLRLLKRFTRKIVLALDPDTAGQKAVLRGLEAARQERYDIDLLGHRFRCSFEQVCHRLTTLRRPGAEGVPFHFVRVDVAGNISKRFAGASFPFSRFGGSCPRWIVHEAFGTPGLVRTQIARLPDGATFFCIARTVERPGGAFHIPRASHGACRCHRRA